MGQGSSRLKVYVCGGCEPTRGFSSKKERDRHMRRAKRGKEKHVGHTNRIRDPNKITWNGLTDKQQAAKNIFYQVSKNTSNINKFKNRT